MLIFPNLLKLMEEFWSSLGPSVRRPSAACRNQGTRFFFLSLRRHPAQMCPPLFPLSLISSLLIRVDLKRRNVLRALVTKSPVAFVPIWFQELFGAAGLFPSPKPDSTGFLFRGRKTRPTQGLGLCCGGPAQLYLYNPIKKPRA